MDNREDLNELLDRASDDNSSVENNNESIIDNEYSQETVDKVKVNSEFSGYFHERDRLDHNNIVDEVKTTLMEFKWMLLNRLDLQNLH